ncbi:MAG TPA: arsenate reductase (glutaredoxin) [Pseudidiomarina sp.]|nr:arsenate reductase (glutaredoxin) [Pseudidiomarina sp.]
MTEVTIYHNPRCSKSRQTLQLLQEHGYEPQVIDYIKNPLTPETLTTVLHQLGFVSARELMRSKEDEFKALNLAAETDEQQLIKAMVEHPRLIERPIVVVGEQARLGRPPEAVLELLE